METLSDHSTLGSSVEAILLPKAVLHDFQTHEPQLGIKHRLQDKRMDRAVLLGIISGKAKQQVGPNI